MNYETQSRFCGKLRTVQAFSIMWMINALLGFRAVKVCFLKLRAINDPYTITSDTRVLEKIQVVSAFWILRSSKCDFGNTSDASFFKKYGFFL